MPLALKHQDVEAGAAWHVQSQEAMLAQEPFRRCDVPASWQCVVSPLATLHGSMGGQLTGGAAGRAIAGGGSLGRATGIGTSSTSGSESSIATSKTCVPGPTEIRELSLFGSCTVERPPEPAACPYLQSLV